MLTQSIIISPILSVVPSDDRAQLSLPIMSGEQTKSKDSVHTTVSCFVCDRKG